MAGGLKEFFSGQQDIDAAIVKRYGGDYIQGLFQKHGLNEPMKPLNAAQRYKLLFGGDENSVSSPDQDFTKLTNEGVNAVKELYVASPTTLLALRNAELIE
jgi:hypothetical protein